MSSFNLLYVGFYCDIFNKTDFLYYKNTFVLPIFLDPKKMCLFGDIQPNFFTVQCIQEPILNTCIYAVFVQQTNI